MFLNKRVIITSFTRKLTETKSKNWINKIFDANITPAHDSHSRLLADKKAVYEFRFHHIYPTSAEKYSSVYRKIVDVFENNIKDSLKLVGSWSVIKGKEDQMIHLWKYPNGYADLTKTLNFFNEDSYKKLFNELAPTIKSRQSQLMLAFSYWGEPKIRKGGNIYELRSYKVKPGTLIEWGNYWAKGINHRQQNDEAVAGFFSQIGPLYNIHHIWAYKDFQSRLATRESAWEKPGWDECVANTVPLTREMDSNILVPNSFSPMQ